MVSFGLSSFRNNNNVTNANININGQRRRRRRKTISPLHSKGMLILALVLLTESVTLTKAVRSVEAASGAGSSFFGGGPSASASSSTTESASTTCTMGSSSCPTVATSASSSSTGLPPIKNTLGGIGKRIMGKNKSGGVSPIAECCQDFHRCSTSQHSASSSASSLFEECDFLTGIPRGGHISSASATSATEAIIGGAAAAAVTATKNMPYNIPLNGWKIIFQTFLTILNVVCWLVPLKSKSFGENKLALSLANAFSGGVFLSLAFGHLIPECVHGFSSNAGGGLVGGLMSNEATPYMLVLSGYMLIFFVEKVAFDAHGALHEMEHAQDNTNKVKGNNKKNGVAHTHSKDAQQQNSGRSAVILLAALAVHSILEMAALGLSDTFSDSALLTVSIALHQPAESIALLVAFLKSGMPKNQIIVFLSIFSLMGPIGCGLGIVVNEFADPIVDSIMLAVVAGTFVYVGATEVIPEEFEDSDNKWKKFTALMSGIISIFAITQYTMTLGL